MKKPYKRILSILLAAAILASAQIITLFASGAEGSEVTMTELKVCNMKVPLGIDITPTFSWILSGTGRDEKQSAYRITVSSTKELAGAGTGDVWDSGKVSSPDTVDIAYEGKALASRTTYYWTAESFASGRTVKSGLHKFSTGILNQSQWQGDWIGKERQKLSLSLSGAKWIWRRDGKPFEGADAGVQYFRRSFTPAAGKTVGQILIGYTADDKAVVYFNGAECGSTTSWYTGGLIDATQYAAAGKNTVAVAATNATTGYAGLIAKIQISYTDGTTETIVTDNSWKLSKTERAGWYGSSYDDSGWSAADQQVSFGESPWGSGVSLEPTGGRAAVMLRKEFQVKKEIKEAYAYICGLGFFELTVNGRLPDDSVLNPFTTQYNKRVLYRTFDVTELLKQGGNAVGVELGNSYYNEIGGVWNWPTAKWRDDPKLLINLEIKYTDGTSDMVVSDTDWTVTSDGPITSNSMYYGDTYDARKEQPGWNSTGFDDSGWQKAAVVDAPEGVLSSQMKAPVKRVAEYPPKEIKKLANGSYILTAPEMTAGWIKLVNINEQAGKKITITYGQRLNTDGTVKRYGGADGEISNWWPHAYIQQDNYICKGTGNESYEPKFSFKGHQYIQIDGYSGELTADDVTIYRTSNDVDTISEFESSNPLFNQLHGMMRAAMANNFQGEHCDPVLEKNGWTGDANVSLGSLMYNFDMTGSLPGWIQVMEDCFDQYGTVPVMAPTADWWIDNSAVWNTLYVYGVEGLGNYFGTGEYAEKQYDTMRKYALKQIGELGGNGWVWYDGQLGDWVSPIGGTDPNVQYNENISEGSGITGTAFVYGVLDYMARLAGSLGKTADAAEYREAMGKVYSAFQTKFYKADKGYYETNTWSQIGTRTRYRQTDNLVPLAFGLVPEEHVESVVANLIKDIEEKDYHLDTGCVGTRYILPVLCDYGYEDVAYKIATQTTYPSWGFWVENGATSTWEMWEATSRSFDHYFLGTYDEWFYSHLAGITDIENGYESFTVKPGLIGDLTYVNASVDTVRGKLSVNWQRNQDDTATVKLTVPFGSTAQVLLPAAEQKGVSLDGKNVSSASSGVKKVEKKDGQILVTVGSGKYSFTTATDGVKVYKDGLKSSIKKAEGIDSSTLDPETLKSYEKALAAAKQAADDSTATQTAVNEAKAELDSVLAALEGSEARKALKALVEGCRSAGYLPTHYPADKWNAYESALLTAAKLSGDYRIEDGRLLQAKGHLEDALTGLQQSKAVNLALNQPPAASSTHNDDYWGWNISFLTDGIAPHEGRQAGEYVGYCSNLTPDKDHTEWVSVNLGKKEQINNVVFYPASSLVDGKMMGYGFPRDFKIQVSDDNETWTTVHEETGYPLPEYGPLSFSFDPVEARYVRLYAESLRPKVTDSNSYRLQLCEMEVYNLPQDTQGQALTYIELSVGTLDPVFHIGTYSYTASAGKYDGSVRVIPYAAGDTQILVNGNPVESGKASAAILLAAGKNTITIKAGDGSAAKTYTIVITKEAGGAVHPSGKEILGQVLEHARAAKAGAEYSAAIGSVKESFDAALSHAEAVYEDPAATAEQIHSAWTALMDELHKLGMASGDKTGLAALLEQAEEIDLDLYQETGKQAFRSALSNAKAVYTDPDAMEAEVAGAVEELTNAMEVLKRKADKSALKALLDQAGTINPDEYTEESAKSFLEAKEAAEEVYEDASASEEQISQAMVQLQKAMDGLKKKGSPSSDPHTSSSQPDDSGTTSVYEPGGSDSSSAPDGFPGTGDVSPILGMSVMLLICGTTAVLTARKRNKR